MKRVFRIAACALLTLITATSKAQFVKGNEAVVVMADGSSRVETPSLPTTGPILRTKPCAANAGCNGGPWLMVETSQGLAECTEAYARPGTCRPSSYGRTKLLRVWLVKSNGKWLQCQLPDSGSKCVDMFAPPPANLPSAAVQ
jgi:hypothetical protein